VGQVLCQVQAGSDRVTLPPESVAPPQHPTAPLPAPGRKPVKGIGEP